MDDPLENGPLGPRPRVAPAARTAAARAEVMRMVLHDLRSPLGAIFAHTDLLLESLPLGRLGIAERRWLETIRTAAEHMERLLGDLQMVPVLESGRLPVERAPVRLDALVHDARTLLAPVAAARSVRLWGRVSPALPPVSADRERLLQVLSNLIGNALDFTPAGGTVSLSAERAGTVVRLSVSDTGCGIDPADLPHVFEPFWRAGRERGKGKGMGLGLAIARAIVEAHTGKIWAESQPGRGTTFHFTLPIAASESGDQQGELT